jgi:hypothetical protein
MALVNLPRELHSLLMGLKVAAVKWVNILPQAPSQRGRPKPAKLPTEYYDR